MFIGKIEIYEEFIQNIENLITSFDTSFSESENLTIDYSEKFDGEFFNTFIEEKDKNQ